MSDRFDSFIIRIDRLSLYSMNFLVAMNSRDKSDVWEVVFRLHQLSRVARVEDIVSAVGVDSAGSAVFRFFHGYSLVFWSKRRAVEVLCGSV